MIEPDQNPAVGRAAFADSGQTDETPGESGDEAVINEAVINEALRTEGSSLIAANFTEGREPAERYGREPTASVHVIDLPAW